MRERKRASLFLIMRPRVFVSSVMKEYVAERNAARLGIEAGGAEPVLIEDFPSLNTSSRNGCLDAIDSCDAVLVLLGERAGWKTPSGKFVVEEEFQHARSRSLPVLAFVQEAVERDADSEKLLRIVSDYVKGHYRKTFETSRDLKAEVEHAVQNLVEGIKNPPVETVALTNTLKAKAGISGESGLRLAILSTRNELFLELPQLAKTSVQDRIINQAIAAEVFYVRRKKSASTNNGVLKVVEHDDATYTGEISAMVTIMPPGLLTMEMRTTGQKGDRRSMDLSRMHEIVEHEVQLQMQKELQFVKLFLDEIDPYHRHEQLKYGWALTNVNHKNLVVNPSKGGSTITLRMDNLDIVVAFDTPELVSRQALESSENVVTRGLDFLRFRMQQN